MSTSCWTIADLADLVEKTLQIDEPLYRDLYQVLDTNGNIIIETYDPATAYNTAGYMVTITPVEVETDTYCGYCGVVPTASVEQYCDFCIGEIINWLLWEDHAEQEQWEIELDAVRNEESVSVGRGLY